MPVRIPNLTQTYPPAPKMTLDASIDKLATFLSRGRATLILCGAGVSVDSGIRAYRGLNGSYTVNKKHRPIFYQEFMDHAHYRRRYWARSYLGYPPVRDSQPNPTHYAIAALQTLGIAPRLITQNVDGLHQKAIERIDTGPSASKRAKRDILELHGTLREAHCISCGHTVERDSFQDELSKLNPDWFEYSEEVTKGLRQERLNPDGDVELGPGIRHEDFNVPPCQKCGGAMKPSVIFFGQSLDPQVRQKATDWVDEADQMCIIGSSLATYSAFRLVRHAKDNKKPVALLNVGDSRADGIVDLRLGFAGGSSQILPPVVKAIAQDGAMAETLDRLCHDAIKTVSGRTTG